ncbi:helix-turn-helix transcriptional regulator [Jongsikchunia kroppenstedtii]|uniref:helix-turn-helix transcriptional regulator n=1 Tax=Jongsikchunia kroppenstedtii TaxID=1121721 RepID=UPI00035E86B7|nr:helix-turn-helix domain-containing protein [Jongsikchunia kroppenstedtii]
MTETHTGATGSLPVVYLSKEQCSELTSLSLSTLKRYRHQGEGPKFYRIANNKVVYRFDEVVAWIEGGGNLG